MDAPTETPLQKILLVCGIPGVGKTTLCHFLDEEHHFVHFDLEHPEGWPTKWGKSGFHDALRATWESSRAEFVSVLHRRYGSQFAGAVLDWSFPPTRLSWVQELQAVGVDVVWMDADDGVARAVLEARGHDLETFDRRLAELRAAGLPGALTGARVIATFDRDGKHQRPADLYQAVVSADAG